MDNIKMYGVWVHPIGSFKGGWLVDDSRIVFNTPSLGAAREQLARWNYDRKAVHSASVAIFNDDGAPTIVNPPSPAP
jgi:hypothetical protein